MAVKYGDNSLSLRQKMTRKIEKDYTGIDDASSRRSSSISESRTTEE
jgi:hypothetical protein